jgi:hypothetical protein
VFAAVHDVKRFRDKTQQFLRAHESDPVIHRLRWNEPLSESDLDNYRNGLCSGRLVFLRPLRPEFSPTLARKPSKARLAASRSKPIISRTNKPNPQHLSGAVATI